ncbi:hypothetical protein V8C37DRAFT_369849 [Trichoderma ceciliae]
MRHPCTTPCLAPYDVPAKERRRHVMYEYVRSTSMSARRLSSKPGRRCLGRVSSVCACTPHVLPSSTSMHACMC